MEDSTRSWRRKAVIDGVPLVVGALPVGLLLGFIIDSAAPSVDKTIAWSSNIYVFAGASQMAMVDLLGKAGHVALVIVVGLVINARHVMYSAALAPRFPGQPTWFKLLAPLWLTDQLFALVSTRVPDDTEEKNFRTYWLTFGGMFYSLWAVWVTIGVFIGPTIPDSWPVAFALPAMFIALVVPTLKTKPALLAAIVGAVVGAAASSLPLGLGLLTGGLIGIAVGTLVERRADA